MKKTISTLFLALLFAVPAFGQEDADKCKDNPMFPKRMPNYFILECSSNFDEVEFNLAEGGSKNIKKEGNKTRIQYNFYSETAQKPSCLEILKNFENAAKSIGGVTMFQNKVEGIETFKMMKDGKESAWVKIECGGSDNSDFYVLTIVQLAEMVQQVTANDILNALNKDGHIALYINFETGKSDIKPESNATIDQVAVFLRMNPTVKLSIEGHTDNVGTAASNLTLSENRAKAVMNYLIDKRTDPSRLNAKGLGQTKPIADNATEEGKAKNRRVEIVKL
ncbi:MAG: OmpA family protein [Bacteroidia bacterium]